jgi:hypothetical protein
MARRKCVGAGDTSKAVARLLRGRLGSYADYGKAAAEPPHSKGSWRMVGRGATKPPTPPRDAEWGTLRDNLCSRRRDADAMLSHRRSTRETHVVLYVSGTRETEFTYRFDTETCLSCLFICDFSCRNDDCFRRRRCAGCATELFWRRGGRGRSRRCGPTRLLRLLRCARRRRASRMR